MKNLGFILLAAGFLAAAYSTALHTVNTNWVLFVPAAIAGLIGVVMIKRHSRGEARSEQVLSANRAELNDSLGNIVSTLERLNEAGDSISAEGLRDEIDSRLRNDLRRFADARESLIYLFGLQAYANVMSDFAAGERYVNRVWSASADGYDGEARNYLGRAAVQFRAAQQQLDSATVKPA
jgi:hypothetical protein